MALDGEHVVAARTGRAELDRRPGTPIYEALGYRDEAKALLRDRWSRWPDCLPPPEPQAAEGSRDWAVNNLFFGAVGWILLHEIAHKHLNHERNTTAELRRRQEFDADGWAADWVLTRVPNDLRFRVAAIASAFTWIGLVDDVFGPGPTHPPAWERFACCISRFTPGALSPGLEIASYAIKTCFLPDEPVPPSPRRPKLRSSTS